MHNQKKYPPPTRPVAMGANGMVSSGSLPASQAGLQVLAEGGNAFDAAVTVASVLGITEPYMSGIGGTGSAVMYVAKEDRVRTLNFGGRVPFGLKTEGIKADALDLGALAPLVPGNVAGWLMLQEKYGTKDRERLFRPAIEYASNGFPFTFANSYITDFYASRLRPFPTSVAILLTNNGKAPRPGAKVTMPQLAASLAKIASHGREVFYNGELAERIVKNTQKMGGVLSYGDLSTYKPEWADPISIDYRGQKVFSTPPELAGFQVLETLKILEGYGHDTLKFWDADSLHIQIEASKLAVADRIKYGGDPAYVRIPVAGLLSADYAAQQRKRIDMASAAIVEGEGYTRPAPAGAIFGGNAEEFGGGHTTHFVVADRDGNVVSITQSLGHYFGSGLAIGDTGIFLNNMSLIYDIDQNSPNAIKPGRKGSSPYASTMTLRDGKFYAAIGTPGGWGITQTTVQMVVNVLDFGMNIQQALDAPLFRVHGGKNVRMEERFPVHLRRDLEYRGHEITVLEPWTYRVGGGHSLLLDQESGIYHGAADPRRDGFALGW